MRRRAFLVAVVGLGLAAGACHPPEAPPTPLPPRPTPTNPTDEAHRVAEIIDASIVSDAGPSIDASFDLDTGASLSTRGVR